MAILTLILPGLAGLAGIGLLFQAWRRRGPVGMETWLGWALLILGLVLWSVWHGLEFGPVFAVTVPGVLALGLIGVRAFRAGAREARPEKGATALGSRRWLQHGLLVLLSVPYAALCAYLVGAGLVSLLPWSELARVATLTLLAPVLWGGFASWLCAEQSPWRPTLSLLGLSLLALIPLLLI